MGLKSFLSGVRAQIKDHAADFIEAVTDGDTVRLSYRGRHVYSIKQEYWNALDFDDLSTVPTDVIRGIVEGCEAVGVNRHGKPNGMDTSARAFYFAQSILYKVKP